MNFEDTLQENLEFINKYSLSDIYKLFEPKRR